MVSTSLHSRCIVRVESPRLDVLLRHHPALGVDSGLKLLVFLAQRQKLARNSRAPEHRSPSNSASLTLMTSTHLSYSAITSNLSDARGEGGLILALRLTLVEREKELGVHVVPCSHHASAHRAIWKLVAPVARIINRVVANYFLDDAIVMLGLSISLWAISCGHSRISTDRLKELAPKAVVNRRSQSDTIESGNPQ